MRMAVGCNVPYTDREWPSRTWDALVRLMPDEITLTSFVAEYNVRRLTEMFPDALYHVRPRTGPQNQSWAETYRDQGVSILDYRSWPTERTMADCLRSLISGLPSGAHPRGGNRITVLMGNEPTLEWCPPYPTLAQVKTMVSAYVPWFHESAGLIYDEYAGVVGVAVAPAAEGDDIREMMYISEAHRGGCYSVSTSFADHCYFDAGQGDFDDRRWGGRALHATDVIGWDIAQRGRVRITETNDNGSVYGEPGRAELYAGYVDWAGRTGEIESVSLFTLPGAPDDDQRPSWWFLTDEIIDAVVAVRATLPDLTVNDGGGPITPPSKPPVIDPPKGDDPMPDEPMLDAVRGGQTLKADELHAKRWAAHALPKLPAAPAFNAEFGFEGAWRKAENAWWGSPLTVHEDKLDQGDGSDLLAARVFTNAVVVWRPGSGAEVIV